MDKYLLQILHEVNTIIIPGLGALTVTNKTSGEIMFMSFLKHDDGNLARHISEKENISENDAKNLIAKYVREIQAKLDTGDTYDMYKFGRFIKKDGEIDFESWNSYQHPAQDEDVPDTEVEAEMHQKEEPPVKPQDVAAQAPVQESELQEGQKEDQKEESKEEPQPETKMAEPAPEEESRVVEANDVIEDLLQASQPVAGASNLDDILNKEQEEKLVVEEPLDAVPEPQDPPMEQIHVEEAKLDVSEINPTENVYIPQEEVQEIAAKQAKEKKVDEVKKVSKRASQPIDPIKPAEKKKTENVEKKSGAMLWIIVLVLVLLAGGATAFYFYKDSKQVAKTEEKAPAESTDENLEEIEKQVELETGQEQAAEETAPVEEEKEQPVAAEEKTAKAVISGDKTYHIIAGGFGVESNADRMAKKYQAEGKSSTVLGKFNELYLVSYEAYATKEEASAAMKSSGIKGWIFKYPK